MSHSRRGFLMGLGAFGLTSWGLNSQASAGAFRRMGGLFSSCRRPANTAQPCSIPGSLARPAGVDYVGHIPCIDTFMNGSNLDGTKVPRNGFVDVTLTGGFGLWLYTITAVDATGGAEWALDTSTPLKMNYAQDELYLRFRVTPGDTTQATGSISITIDPTNHPRKCFVFSLVDQTVEYI